MRIAHAVTLVSPDGAFGGPVRVATNQASALRSLGHDVTIIGAYAGFDTAPTLVEDIPAKLFRARRLVPSVGFPGLVAPGLMRYLVSTIGEYDVIHVHLARDLVTLPTARIAQQRGVPYVMQPHGMVDRSDRLLAKVLDAVATRSALRCARALFYLTNHEAEELALVADSNSLPLEFLFNGVPPSSLRANISDGHEVLFLARLHPRKRPLAFVDAAIALHSAFPHVRFSLVGPDEGEAAAVMTRISEADASKYIQWEGPLPPSKTAERMAKASVYVLPSLDEPFPMSVLEAMSMAMPCVVTDSCGLLEALHDKDSVVVVTSTTDSLELAISRLLQDRLLRVEIGRRAHTEVNTYFGTVAVADQLSGAYHAAAKS